VIVPLQTYRFDAWHPGVDAQSHVPPDAQEAHWMVGVPVQWAVAVPAASGAAPRPDAEHVLGHWTAAHCA
jgi:hypothetical protein